MAESADASDGFSSRTLLFWSLAVLGAVLMYLGEGIIGTSGTVAGGLTGQELSAIGLTLILTAGTILVVVIHWYDES